MSDLTKRAALFIGPDEYDSRFLDSSLAFDPLSELEPVAKRPRTSERGNYYLMKLYISAVRVRPNMGSQ